MSFKFNFYKPDGFCDDEVVSSNGRRGNNSSKDCPNHVEEVVLTNGDVDYSPVADVQRVGCKPCISYIPFSNSNSVIAGADIANTDLVPGVYEGGFKIWESTFDLLTYFEERDKRFNSQRVLDIGCGAGLLGLYALRTGAECVHFQDYNVDVLDTVTKRNILCNMDKESVWNCRLFSGDWQDVAGFLLRQQLQYDCILTSETIYSCQSYQKLHHLFHTVLTDNGEIYIATKAHYFGVGGGTLPFTKYVATENVFACEKRQSTGTVLRRDILKLSRK